MLRLGQEREKLEPFHTMLTIPERSVLEDGQLVEQVSQVKARITLNLVDAVVVSPFDVQRADGLRVMARGVGGPRVGPHVDGGTTLIVPAAFVDVPALSRLEERKQFVVGIA